MKHVLSLLLLGLVWAGTSTARAQESLDNEMELLRQLNNKKWFDLAKVKIEQLLKLNNPQLNAILPLELARIDLAIVSQQDVTQRFAVYEKVRAELDKVAQQNAGKLQGVYASIELARVDLAFGQALLMKAMREQDIKTRHDQARPAEKRFMQAAEDYQKAIKVVDQAIKEPANANFKASLETALQHLKLESSMVLFHQARTYINRENFDVLTARAALMAKAIKAFEELEKSDKDQSVAFLATAWLMKCSIETNQPLNIVKYYNSINNKAKDKSNARAIYDAHRLVEYFWMQDKTLKRDIERDDETETIGTNPDNEKIKPAERLKMVRAKGHELEKRYPNLLQTEDGQGILFELAYTYFWEGRSNADPKISEPAMKQAEKYFKLIATKNSEVADRARQLTARLEYQRVVAGKGELKSFDDFFTKAMSERRRVQEVNGKLEQLSPDKDKAKISSLEAERKKHLRDVVNALNTAMAMATPQTPTKKVDEIHYYLSGAHLVGGDPFRGVIVAEAWGRSRSPRAAEGVASALQTYSSLQSRFPDNPTLRRRLEDLAHFALSDENQQLWKNDPVTGLAHYHLAMSADREGKTREAIKHLEQLPPTFIDYAYTQGQLVFIALKASDKTLKKEEKKEYVKLALAAIDRMPKIDMKKESPSVVVMYFIAKLEKAKFLYSDAMEELKAKEELKAAKKCNEMANFVRGLQAEFADVPPTKLTKENNEQIPFTMSVMLKYADLGLAEVRFRSDAKDRFKDVIAATKTVVDNMMQKAAATPGDEPIRLKDYRVTGDILGLSLRAHVQQGEIAKAKTILDVLKRLQDEKDKGGSGGGAGVVVGLLLNDISANIKAMIETKDPALKETKGNYAAFLKEIAKEFDVKGWDTKASLLFGHAFSSLEMYGEAAQAFAKIKPPATLDKKVEKIVLPKEGSDEAAKKKQDVEFQKMMQDRDKWEAEIRQYWGAQVEYVRALRASKEKGAFQTADKVISSLLAAKNPRFQVQAMIERNHFLDDEARYRESYLEWSKLLKMKALEDRTNPDVQKIYFPSYFYKTRSLYKMSVHDKALKDPQKFLVAAAKDIVTLEFANTKVGWTIAGPMFQELLKAEPKLREEYEKQKAERKLAK